MSDCWLCGQAIRLRSSAIGARSTLVSRTADGLQTLGELELDLRADDAGRDPLHDLGSRPAS